MVELAVEILFFKCFLLYVANLCQFEAGKCWRQSGRFHQFDNASGHEDLLIDSVARCQWECWKSLRMEALGLHPSAMWKRIQREALSSVIRGQAKSIRRKWCSGFLQNRCRIIGSCSIDKPLGQDKHRHDVALNAKSCEVWVPELRSNQKSRLYLVWT